MAHGYLGDGYGTHGEIDPDRGDDRDRHWRDRDRARNEDWRDRDRMSAEDWRDRDRGAFFDERSFRAEQERWDERGQRWPEDRWPEQRGRASGYNRQAEDWSGQHRRTSADPDEHYRGWRDRHMAELDRDYADYCREREEQFHRDFDHWRRQKYGNPQPLRTGMTQTGMSHDPSGMTQAAEETAPLNAKEPSPVADATLGTNSGRSRSRG